MLEDTVGEGEAQGGVRGGEGVVEAKEDAVADGQVVGK